MRIARRVSYVIFDLDGVLLDTEPIYTEATQEVVAPYGKVFDWSVKADMIGRSSDDGAAYLVRTLDLPIAPQDYLARREPILRRLFPGVAPIAGAPELIEAFAACGVPLALATSSERELYELKVSRHDFFSHFRAVVCGDDPRVERLKPDPDIFLVAARELGAEPEECLVFEDSLAGVAAAKAAGMPVVALPDPAMDATRYGDADLVISRLSDVTPADFGF